MFPIIAVTSCKTNWTLLKFVSSDHRRFTFHDLLQRECDPRKFSEPWTINYPRSRLIPACFGRARPSFRSATVFTMANVASAVGDELPDLSNVFGYLLPAFARGNSVYPFCRLLAPCGACSKPPVYTPWVIYPLYRILTTGRLLFAATPFLPTYAYVTITSFI